VEGAEGQQAIIQLLLLHPEGLSLDALAQSTGMNNADLQEVLNTLKRHDVASRRRIEFAATQAKSAFPAERYANAD
jgi:DNA-binding IclR family transcriptional regulator